MDISLIILNYNLSQFVSRAIRSCLAQIIFRKNIEIIVVDDNSTDDSLKIINEFNNDIKNHVEKFSIKFSNKELNLFLKNYLLKFGEYIKKNNISFDGDNNETIIQIDVKKHFKLNLLYPSLSITDKITFYPNKKIILTKQAAWLLVSGIWNFESLYIGQHADFERNPIEKFNQILIMQLQTFGYVYQKRMIPEELNNLIKKKK